MEILADEVHRNLDLLAPQQVLDPHLADGLQVVGLVDRGSHQHLDAALDGQLHHAGALAAEVVVHRIEQPGDAQLGD